MAISTDGTSALVREMSQADPRIRLIENPDLFVPLAMNIGIRSARGRYIGRVDGHCQVEPGYFERCLKYLDSGHYACAGGVLINEGSSATGCAIAAALSSPLAVGGASFRTGTSREKEVDTVAYGVYRREVFDEIGGFDEQLVSNQDDELNLRITMAGERILLLPHVHVRYHVRNLLKQLSRQYFQYGYWKLKVTVKHKRLTARGG